ncbi:PhzF family phenazine biosynthesis protein [Alicyclobacillus pomorum]|jgi:PhzF family phenazine biosynthesis protein|uniref:PhzF family phenazine biosynthesis protein n=1 Tax=Alicyclobacillus pomorum TaxID=204470 RepID=UPI0003FDD8F2|nr:PhzF family phenazine biosynthesis protein [Alicyclobacillus pomorum]
MNLYIIDAFTSEPFKGNPAAVCLLKERKDDQWMQNVAKEMNLSETAFLYPLEDGYELRWFTPVAEVELCGHATLASAHYLWETGIEPEEKELRFFTKSGWLTAKLDGGWIELNFPLEQVEACEVPEQLEDALGVKLVYAGSNRMDLLVEVESERQLRELQPNFSKLSTINARGILVTSRAEETPFDFVSRCFFPAVGVNEDPVTGSAHCALAPYWQSKLGTNHFLAKQLSAREGILRVQIQDDRVLLAGQAVTVVKGELL